MDVFVTVKCRNKFYNIFYLKITEEQYKYETIGKKDIFDPQ